MDDDERSYWCGWDDFVELDQDEQGREDWSYEDEAWWVAYLVRDSAAHDVHICLECGEVIVQCVCAS